MSFSVPVVDITPYVAGGDDAARAEVARAVDRACSEVGFIQVLGHGIPEPVTDGLAGAMDEFFALEMDAKRAYRTPAGINRGYAPPKTESLSLSLGVESANRMNDFFEAFNVGLAASDFPGVAVDPVHYAENTWPDADAPGFRGPVEAYFAEAGRVARTMTRTFADALGVDHEVFTSRTDHSLDVLRMNNYALPAGTDVRLDGDLTGMGEHTDYGIVTVLWADRVRGLQVLGPGALEQHIAAGHGRGHGEGAGFDAIGNDFDGGSVQLLDTFDSQCARADARDFCAHGHKAFSHIGDLGFLCGIFDDCRTARQGGGHQDRVGGPNRDFGEADVGADQPAFGGARHDIAFVDINFGAQLPEAIKEQIHRSRTDSAAPWQGDACLVAARQERADDPEAGAHLGHQVIRGGGVDDVGGVEGHALSHAFLFAAATSMHGNVDAMIF